MLTLLLTAIGLLLLVTGLLGIAIWSLTHVRHGRWDQLDEADVPEKHFPEMVAGLCLSTLCEGNAFKVLQNGDAFWPTLHDLAKASEQTVHFETFLWKSGTLSQQLVEVFCERARAGVAVRMVIDAEGGSEMAQAERERLRAAGVELHFFRPPRLRNLGTFNGRDHRKLALFDSKTALLGGHCVTDAWLGNAQDSAHYRDLSVQVTGPVVTQLQSTFSENWTEATSQLLVGHDLFTPQEATGNALAHVAYITLQRRVSAVKTLYMTAILSAKRQVLIQNPYFLPDAQATAALREAVNRGVKVRIMTPTIDATDNPWVIRAMRHGLGPILEAGVEVLGYKHTLLHQKVATIDGHWAIIGSTNFDFRSFEINEEVNVSVFDTRLARELEATFEDDLKHCRPYRLEDVRKRNLQERFLDRLAWLVREQL